MEKKRLTVLITILAITLGGIMIIQLYGIRNAIQFQNKQFAGTVEIGLRNVSNKIYEIQVDTNAQMLQGCSHINEFEWMEMLPLLDLPKIERLIDQEFQKLGLNLTFETAIYDYPLTKIYKISNPEVEEKILASPHHVALNCLFDKDEFRLSVYFPKQMSVILKSVIPWAFILFLLIIVLIITFYKIIMMFLYQKQLTEMKNDFVNNMTHEFKTPIATISLATDMLLKTEVNSASCQVERYAKIISDENNRLKSRVEQVLHITLVDKGNFRMKMKPADIHKIIEEGLKPYRLLMRKQKGTINLNFNATRPNLIADPGHLENVVSNLVDNAIKYSIGAPDITLETSNNNKGIFLVVQDHGIGIGNEYKHDVFKRFFRVPTGDLHDAKGFGLGLYYVKTVVDAHNGTINVESQPGKGSRFEVFLPFENQS
ncbi:MAG: HAMP domain-containing sensor histidine kinase [Bacteroidales bacterium]